MKSVQKGDAGAYELLLVAITPRLRSLVKGRWRFLSTEDSEDLVQDILLLLHSARAKYDPQNPFLPWLFTISRNRMADAGRWHFRNKAHEVHVENLEHVVAIDATIADNHEYQDSVALKEAIRQLPAGQRAAIEMLKLRELSMSEAVKASGTSAGALRISVFRAIANLRKTLGVEVQDFPYDYRQNSHELKIEITKNSPDVCMNAP